MLESKINKIENKDKANKIKNILIQIDGFSILTPITEIFSAIQK